MIWLALQLGSILLNSVNTILDKRFVRDYTPNPVLYLLSFALVGLPVVGVGTWHVPWPGWQAAGTGIFVGLLFTVMVLLYYKAMSLAEASRLAPIDRLGTVLQLALLAVIWGDQLRLEQYAAFGLMALGAMVLGRQSGQSVGRFGLSQGMIVMGLFVMTTAVYGAVGSQLNLAYSPWVRQLWSNVGIILGTGLLLLIPSQRHALRQGIARTPHNIRGLILGEQTGRLFTSVLADVAVSTVGSAAIVSVFGGLRPLFVLILATRFLGETINRNKIIGVTLIMTGTAFLLMGI